ncbi:MAG: DUF2848 family protein [Pseudomonadota bacterium]|nr:DUF2848 family protein [Pseudomonadota bacterium]
MSSSFIYQPHVHQSNGGVVTPDIAINRVYIFEGGRHSAFPVSQLTSRVVTQRYGSVFSVVPMVAIIEAGFGMLLSIGVACANSLLVSRQAWRYRDVSDDYGDLILQSRTVPGGGPCVDSEIAIGELPSVSNIMEVLGHRTAISPGTAVFAMKSASSDGPVVADRYEVILEGPESSLSFEIDLQPIH